MDMITLIVGLKETDIDPADTFIQDISNHKLGIGLRQRQTQSDFPVVSD